VLAGLVVLTGTLAGASIEWDAPTPDCPSVAEVEAAVQRMAGRLPEPHEIRATALVGRDGAQWTLRLTTEVGGRVQQRSLDADSCDALAKATAIVVAVAIDPVGAAHEVRSAERIATPTRAPAVEPDVAPAVVVVAPERGRVEPVAGGRRGARPPVRIHLGIGGGVAIGAVPRVSGGPVAAFGLTAGRLRAELRGAWWAPRVGRNGGASARIQLGTIGVVVCGEPGPARARFPICAGIESGAMRARGVDVPNAQTAHLPWVAAVVGAGVRGWVHPRIGLRADVEVGVPIAVDRVVVGPPTAEEPLIVHQSPRVGARGVVGVEFRLR
jgi:hypothetical protein